jgi:hypothetical protein
MIKSAMIALGMLLAASTADAQIYIGGSDEETKEALKSLPKLRWRGTPITIERLKRASPGMDCIMVDPISGEIGMIYRGLRGKC